MDLSWGPPICQVLPQDEVSKRLSAVLRGHRTDKVSYSKLMDDDLYMRLSIVAKILQLEPEVINQVATASEKNNRRRFDMSWRNEEWWIRATRKHTLQLLRRRDGSQRRDDAGSISPALPARLHRKPPPPPGPPPPLLTADSNPEQRLVAAVEQPEVWQQYASPNGSFWWWCEAEKVGFVESPRGMHSTCGLWNVFADPHTEQHYWWKDDEHCFWKCSGRATSVKLCLDSTADAEAKVATPVDSTTLPRGYY